MPASRSVLLSLLENLPFEGSLLPEPAYLVGGAVRDALRSQPLGYLDLDFVLPQEAVATARAIARHHRGGFVLLDAERQIARVVLPGATVDIAQQEGDTIETDLHRRDFTVNAIACHVRSGAIADPLGGREDLHQGILRMVAAANLEADPLRLLRAYRQAAQLGMAIAPETQATIRHLAPLVKTVAAERVRVELQHLLAHPEGATWLRTCWQDGLLGCWFPSATAAGLARSQAVDAAVARFGEELPEFHALLEQEVRPTLKTTWAAIAKLSYLVATEVAEASVELLALKYSNAEMQGVLKLQQGKILLSGLTGITTSARSQYELFKTVGNAFPALGAIAVVEGADWTSVCHLAKRYLDPDDPVAHPAPLLSGHDLMETLHIPKGKQIGHWLEALALARAEGIIASREEALQWVKEQLP